MVFIAFGTYGGGEGDYWHLKESVENCTTLTDVLFGGGMEQQYKFLAYWLDGNYTLWRLIIYSLQFIGMFSLLKAAKLNTYSFLLIFTTMCLVPSVYGRAFWGGIFFFIGMVLLINKRNPLFLLIMLLSYFSHTQNVLLIALLPLCLFNINKWHILLMVLLLGVVATAFKDYFTLFVDSGGIEGADYINSKVNEYSSDNVNVNDSIINSIGELILFIIRYVPLFVFLFYLSYLVIKSEKVALLATPFRRMIGFPILLFFFSLVLLRADINENYFYRCLVMMQFPISLIMSHMQDYKLLKKKTFLRYNYLFTLAFEFSYCKDLYYAYAGGLY